MQKLLILCALEKELPVRENPYSSITVYTGVGKVNAAMMAAFSIKSRRPDMIINYGTAGSCNKCVISTGDNFVTKELNFCDLVDMESYAIAKVCKKTKTEFKCYKYITDYVNSSSMNDWEEKIGDGYELFLEQIDDYIKNSV